MKRLFALLLCCLLPALVAQDDALMLRKKKNHVTTGGGGGGTWTHVQDCTGAGVLVCTFASNPTQHDTVVVYLGALTSTGTLSCSDGNSNAYTVSATHGSNATAGFTTYVAYILDAPATANKTITCSGLTTSYRDTHASEFKDTGGTPALDSVYGSSGSTNSTPSILLPSFTPAVSGSLGFCGVLPNTGISSANSPWTLGVNSNSATEYQLSAGASSTTANFTDTINSDAYASICIVVKS